MENIIMYTRWPAFGKGLFFIVKEQYKGLEVCLAESEQAMAQSLANHSFQLAIFWVSGKVEISFVTKLLRIQQLPVLIITEEITYPYIMKLYESGASGIFDPTSSLDELKDAIKDMLNGKIYIPEIIKQDLLKNNKKKQTRGDNKFYGLTKRELEITELLLQGKSLTAIGNVLNIRVTTVSTIKGRAFTKLGVNNLVELFHKLEHEKALNLS